MAENSTYFLVDNHEPWHDRGHYPITRHASQSEAIRYAQNLEAMRVDVIKVFDDHSEYVARYPISQYSLHNGK